MHLALTRQVDAVSWRIPEVHPGNVRRCQAAKGRQVRSRGIAEERLWPKAEAAFSGYQLLLEYFTFREKFLFVDLCGLDIARLPDNALNFEVEILLEQSYPADHALHRG